VTFEALLAHCLHDPAALAPAGGLPALTLAMALAGLAGGATHCAGMCAPFVLAQGAARAGAPGGGRGLERLAGAALLPYHLGRALGYAALGALAGGAAGLVTLPAGRPWLALPLAAAAVLMLAQGCTRLGLVGRWRTPAPGLPAVAARAVARLLAAPTGVRGVLLGLLLSALPCGLLYGALAGAVAAGSATGGAVAMAAFAAGTAPALIGVGLVGRLFQRRFGSALGRVASVLFLLNAVALAAMAARVAGA
jgi:sulfite exporter TauE/SafE